MTTDTTHCVWVVCVVCDGLVGEQDLTGTNFSGTEQNRLACRLTTRAVRPAADCIVDSGSFRAESGCRWEKGGVSSGRVRTEHANIGLEGKLEGNADPDARHTHTPQHIKFQEM